MSERLELFMESRFDLKGLKEAGLFQTIDPDGHGYIKNLKDYEAMAQRIEIFFNLTSIYEYDYLQPLGRVVHSASEFLKDVDHLTIEPN